MKKLLLVVISLFGIFVTQNASAQFSIPKDTVSGLAMDDGLVLYNNIKNIGTDTLYVTWRIFYNNIPAAPSKWNTSFGLCDNRTCYSNGILNGNAKTTDFITAGSECDFHIVYSDLTNVTTYGPYYISVELTSGSQIDTAVFVIDKFPTSIKNQNVNATINVYPVPAGNELNVNFKGSNVKSASIYNLIGDKVIVREISGDSAKIDLSNVAPGIYFLKLNDDQGNLLGTRKFTKQ